MSPLRPLCSVLWQTYRYMTFANRHPETVGRIKSRWAQEILRIFRVERTLKGEISREPVLFVGNHISYLDIPLLMSLAPVNFLAKRELGKWPLFGKAMTAGGTVFVDRSSKESRAAVGPLLAEVILSRRQPVAIFPSGTTTVNEAVPWRHGAFRMAQENRIPIQPFRLTYTPLREAAFIDDDAFLPHLWRLLRHPVRATLEFGPVHYVTDPATECEALWRWAQQVVH